MAIKKTIIITIILTTIHLILNAQTRIKFINSKANFAYLGLQNEFTYKSANKNLNPIWFKCKNGTVVNKKGKLFFGTLFADTAEIEVFTILRKDTVKQYSQKIIIRKISTPKIASNGKLIEGYQNKTFIENVSKLDGYVDVDLPSYKFEVTSFSLNIIQNKNQINYSSSNNKLTSEMKEALKNIQTGDILKFYNINLKGTDGLNRMLNRSIVVKIK